MRRFPGFKKHTRPRFTRGSRPDRKKRFEPNLQTDQKDLRVRSSYEKKCIEFFEKNDINFQYEPLLLIGGRKYRPDFFLPQFDLFLEICGYNHMPFYRDRVEHKKRTYEKYGLKVIFISYSGKGSLERILKEKLRQL